MLAVRATFSSGLLIRSFETILACTGAFYLHIGLPDLSTVLKQALIQAIPARDWDLSAIWSFHHSLGFGIAVVLMSVARPSKSENRVGGTYFWLPSSSNSRWPLSSSTRNRSFR
jgi:hypothetical protein